MKKLVLCMILGMTLFACSACSSQKTEGNQAAANETAAADESSTDDAAKPTEETTAATGELQQIGSDTLGYMEIPADWTVYEDEKSPTALQYTSADNRVIVSMDVIDKSAMSEEEQSKLTAESAAQSIWTTLDQGGVKQLKGAKVQLAGCDAFQVYGVYTQGADDTAGIIVNWVFESEDGVLHVISAEGATENVMDGVTQIESTYQLTK